MLRVLLACCLALSAPLVASAQFQYTTSAVVSGVWAYLPEPAEQISGAGTTDVFVEPTGRWVLSARSYVKPEAETLFLPPASRGELEVDCSVSLWNPRLRRSTVLWRYKTARFGYIHFLGAFAGGVLIELQDGESRTLLRFDAEAGTVRKLTELDPLTAVAVSPKGNLAALIRTGPEKSVQFLSSDGKIGPSLTFPKDLRPSRLSGLSSHDWTTEATGLVFFAREEKTEAIRYWALAYPSGELTPTSPPQPLVPAETKTLLQTVASKATVSDSAARLVQESALWLEGEKSSEALLAVGALPGGVHGDGRFALYYQSSCLYAVPLLRVPRAAYEVARREAEKRVAVANARMFDSALEQYALDNKDFPPPGSDLLDLLVGTGTTKYIKGGSDAFRDKAGNSLISYVWNGSKEKGAPMATVKWRGGTITIRYNDDFTYSEPGR
ncbi:hypothetical protein [Armatimonas rosea]|uniref:Uncharacterized protein n=1 Tax=Armatimonas rosea TaxID=685828 RepID=A0A7W9W7T7_ARMRO|nr:hypothetical protein [Armatimonas rosea]MBB6052023.1 hypothetical protein [Armatimonas rosea]